MILAGADQGKNTRSAIIQINMKKALITGTSRGIGLATAKKFLEEGWFVLGASTSENEILKHANYKHYLLNLSDPESINSCTNLIKKQNREIDVLINCAGVSYEPDENKMDVSILRRVLEVNLIGTIDFTEHLLTAIKPSGHIVAISSMMSSLVNFNNGDCPSYRISKTALNMYLKTLADRLKNVTVSAFDPGWVKTDMGGKNAPRSPEEPAEELYSLVTTIHPTGDFWFEGKIRPW
jgi:NAD(P)-dependent dehydrogenase (short-subunit alcohol dehydrogenase family)